VRNADSPSLKASQSFGAECRSKISKPCVAANVIVCLIRQANCPFDQPLRRLEKLFLCQSRFTERLRREFTHTSRHRRCHRRRGETDCQKSRHHRPYSYHHQVQYMFLSGKRHICHRELETSYQKATALPITSAIARRSETR